MPRFLDHHKNAGPMPKQAVDAIRASVKAGKADQFGVKPIDVLIAEADNESFCLTEAPSAESVVKSHKSMGIEMGTSNVKKVTSVASS